MAVGTGGALEMCMTALCDRGQHILLPKPGFTLFRCYADTMGIEAKYYSLLVCFCKLCIVYIHVFRNCL